MGIDVAKQLADILEEYGDEAKEVARAEAKKAARKTAKELRSVSPKKTGKYASGWTSKQVDADTVTVYNSKAPGQAHLLENGHVIRNKKGTYGRAPARKHIAPVEQANNEAYVQSVISKLR